MRWLENRLGRYPFDRAGIVVTPSGSAMETQTMVTFGAQQLPYGNRDVRRTVVHEMAHQWYGDTVTPKDWRDLWMNEGMATYQDTRWAVDQGWTTWRHWQRQWKRDDQLWRDIYGAPGDYHRREFGSINVYYCTALMWDRLRHRLGTATFNRLVRAWPQRHLRQQPVPRHPGAVVRDADRHGAQRLLPQVADREEVPGLTVGVGDCGSRPYG